MKLAPPLPENASAEHALDLLREMMRIRRFEERSAELYSAQEIRGFLHLYIGEEAVAVGVMQALETQDAIVATYREHGHALARGISARSIMAELLGRRDGCSGGRGGSMHLFDATTRFYGGWAIVGGGLPIATGLALAAHLRGESQVVACFFGEGAVAEGEFHEAMNLAALWRLPVLFCCENNGRPAELYSRFAVVGDRPFSSSRPIVFARTRCSIRSSIEVGRRSKVGRSMAPSVDWSMN